MKPSVALSVLSLVLLIFYSAGCGSPESPSGSNEPSQPPSMPKDRPGAIIDVFPAEGSLACPTPEVGAAFRLHDKLLASGNLNLQVVSLSLGGANVTQEATVRTTMDFPPSRADLVYVPKAALKEGLHQASITFPDVEGKPQTYTWSFQVQQGPCR